MTTTLMYREVAAGALPPEGHPTILIIDDDPASRDSVAATLSVEGFDVVTATGEEEGTALIRAARPSLVLLDMQVADSQGLAVFRRIVTLAPGLPVIMVTARDDELDAVLSLEAGAADHVTKPARPRELTARIRAVLRRVAAAITGRCRSRPERRLRIRPRVHRRITARGDRTRPARRVVPQGVRPPGAARLRGGTRGDPSPVHGPDLA